MLIQDLVIIAKGAKSYIKANRVTLPLSGIEQTLCIHIYLNGQTNQDHLAKALMMDKGNMARTLTSLEKEGLVHRVENPHNRRENLVSITARGEELIQPLIQLCTDWEYVALQSLSDEEAALFRNVCSKISQEAEQWKEVEK